MDDATKGEIASAFRALLDKSPENITFEGGSYQDCLYAYHADEKLLAQLMPQHCRAISQTFIEYVDQAPNMSPRAQKETLKKAQFF